MEEIVKAIAYELSRYEKNNKIVDQGFIQNVVHVFLKYYNIEDFVSNCEFNNTINSQIKSGYNISDKKIFFGIKNEVANAYKQIRGNGIDFNKESITMFINYRLIGTIIHELTHSLQYYKCLNKIDDFETFLLGYGLNKNIILLNNNKQLLNDGLTKYLLTIDSLETNEIYYLTVPNERMASITITIGPKNM